MAESAIEQTWRYPYASALSDTNGNPRLQLATSQQAERYPYFFEGKLLQPRTTAQLLFVLSRIVSTRFYTPPAMLRRLLIERDPVITSGGGVLRFEGLSACCSAYTRVDLTPDAYSGEVLGSGTTNVDFNADMRAALARTRDQDRLSLAVGPDEVMLKHGFDRVVEKKVRLPLRWLKGFAEVQAYQSQMELRMTVGKSEAIRFLRSLPVNAHNKSSFYVVSAGQGLRLSKVQCAEGVKIGGLSRLTLLKELAPLADELKIYAHPSGDSSEWQLRCGGLTYSLTVTAEPSRGFSGEGQVLYDLANADTEKLAQVKASLRWQSSLSQQDLSSALKMHEASVRQCLGLLGSRGLVGYDLALDAYFHRELPFDMELVEEIHPRLKSARKLVSDDKLKILSKSDALVEAEVAGSGVSHRVRVSDEKEQCTCQWHSQYQGARGPCKHILAVKIAAGVQDED